MGEQFQIPLPTVTPLTNSPDASYALSTTLAGAELVELTYYNESVPGIYDIVYTLIDSYGSTQTATTSVTGMAVLCVCACVLALLPVYRYEL